MDDVHPKMRFSLSPPASKTIFSSSIKLGSQWSRESSGVSSKSEYQNGNNNNNNNNNEIKNSQTKSDKDTMQRVEDRNNSNKSNTGSAGADAESTSDYKQWLHAMKLVARLPGGIPPEFRRKLWLSLADKYLKAKNVDWSKEEEKCFCEKWREDDEELGIQIVKDLHRTGSTLCTGPAGDVNQAKLKRILLGYARYNPEVGYCQGFNMLGALMLQVMDKDETESMKVMIYLVEGILPPGYFCGSMGGLQADMAVFRELMQTKLPRLAKHLQKLQGPTENAFEPPLTNVFTMQWFLTMFCTCLPMSCVLRVWDLVLIEGSDVLLRTALVLWSLLEDRVLSTRSADDFYGKMGSFSSELLNGHLIDSNGLIEKVVQLGPIQDIEKLRDKHLNIMTPLKNRQGLNLYYDEDEADMDEDSRLAVATVWGLPWGRRGSQGQAPANAMTKQAPESKDRIALDISLLKKQYDRLRERQKQAHIILTTACSTARQSTGSTTYSAPLPVNQLLSGRPAIVTNRGRRNGPPLGAIPPARKPSLPAVLQDKPLEKKLRRVDTIQWRDTSETKRRRDSLTWKEIKAERAALSTSGSIDGIKSQKIRTKRLGKSDSSSYSEESDEEVKDKAGSSSDTSLCDDDNQGHTSNRITAFRSKTLNPSSLLTRQKALGPTDNDYASRQRPKSWAPSNSDIPFVLMTTDSPGNSADEGPGPVEPKNEYMQLPKEQDEDEDEEEEEGENSATESDQNQFGKDNDMVWSSSRYSPLKEDTIPMTNIKPLDKDTDSLPTSLMSPVRLDHIIETAGPTSPPPTKTHLIDSANLLGSEESEECNEVNEFGITDEGVTNQYFERVNSTERPTKLDLFYSLNEETSIHDTYKETAKDDAEESCLKNNKNRCMDLLVDYSEKSSAACIAEAKTEISSTLNKSDYTGKLEISHIPSAASKRRNPRRLTLTRSTTMEIEKRYQALEKRMSMEASSKYKIPVNDKDDDIDHSSAREDHKKPSQRILITDSPQDNGETHQLRGEDKETAASIVSILQRKSKIPSTADLELRFASIVLDKTRKVSSVCDSEGADNSRKNPASPKESSKRTSTHTGPTKEAEIGESKSKESKSKNETRSSAERVVTDEDTKSNEVEETAENDPPSNVKSHDNEATSKKALLQRKKEPPDNVSEKDSISEDSQTKSKAIKNANKSETARSEKQGSHDLDVEKEETAKSPRQPNTNVPEVDGKRKTSSASKKEEADRGKRLAGKHDENQDNSKRKTLIKKSPPSTEELEKRFNALEKQMSVTKSESEVEEDDSVLPEKEQEMEEDDRNDEIVAPPSGKSANMANQVLNAMMTSSSRRASEPPSTEDLEKRYEVFKRRMSSKVLEMNANKRKASEPHLSDAEHDSLISEDIKQEDQPRSSAKESPPSTDSLEKRYHKLQRDAEAESVKSAEREKLKSEESQSKSKETLSGLMHKAAKVHRTTESPTASKDSLSGIVQMAVDAAKALESPSTDKDSLGNIAQRVVKAKKDAETPTKSKESFSDIMHKAVEAQKTAETPTSSKESFSDIMHQAVRAQKTAETPTKSKDSFSDIMHQAVKAQKTAETPTKGKDSFSDIMHKAVEAQKTAETPTSSKESFSDIMHQAVRAQKTAETPTKSKDSFSDIMHQAVRAQKTAETPTPSKESFSDIMHQAVRAQKTAETPTSSKESFSDIMHQAVRAQKTADTPTKSKESFSDIMHQAVKAQKTAETPTKGKESFSDIMHQAVRAQKTAETPTPSKETFSDIMHQAVRAQKTAETPTKGKESFSDIMHKAVEAQKTAETPTSSKESFSDIMHQAVRAHKTAETPTKSKDSFSDIMHQAVRAQKTAETPTPSKESFSDIMHQAVRAQKTAETPTKGKESFSDIMHKAVEAQKTAETPTSSKESFSDIMHQAVRAHKTAETPTKSKDSFSDIMHQAVRAQKTAETPTPSKESFSDIMHQAVRAQKTAETPTKGKESFSDIMHQAVKAQKTTETPTPSKESFSDIMHQAVRAHKTAETPTPSKESFSDIMHMAVRAHKAVESSTPSRESLSSIVQLAVDSHNSTGTPTKERENFADIAQRAIKPHTSKDSLGSIVQMAVESHKTEEMYLEDKAGKPAKRSALIEELQSKMSATTDGENVKPSSINPNRKITQNAHLLRKSKTDETSETHATTAFSKSEKNEQFHSQNRKMVRRFSDLPSRADLENRLLFLEEQLSKSLLQQRRASDSEVASHSRGKVRSAGIHRHSDKLEVRVRELEKQLSGANKSAKELDNLHPGTSRIPLEITTDSSNVSGKELVRYAHFGEIDEPDIHNPINISINIHMTLNKDDLNIRTGTQNLSTAEEINKRLLILEQQLNTSKINIASSSSIPRDICDSARSTSSDQPASAADENLAKTIQDVPLRPEIENIVLCKEPSELDTESNQKLDEPENERLEETIDREDHIAVEPVTVVEEQSNEAVAEHVQQTVEVPVTAAEKQSNEKTADHVDVTSMGEKQINEKTADHVNVISMEEEKAAQEVKRLEASAKADDMDKRLKILEEHVRKSQPLAAADKREDREPSKPTAKEVDVEVVKHSKIDNTKRTEETKLQEETKATPRKAAEKSVSNEKTARDDAASKKDSKSESDKNQTETSAQTKTVAKRIEAPEPEFQEGIKASEYKSAKGAEAHEPECNKNEKHTAQESVGKLAEVPMETLDTSQMVPIEVNKKTLVLVLDNEPKAVKVRRLTRANTEELEGLFQALEKQLLERGQVKHDDVVKAIEQAKANTKAEEAKAAQEMSDLSKEIEELAKSCAATNTPKKKTPKKEDDFDWGMDPVKHHLKKKTVYLPSTKELESRFRSLERQIKVLEDVEKIDVEQRLNEIDRKLKLQYSLSHEKDLVRFLDLCEGKGLDDTPPPMEQNPPERTEYHEHCCEHTTRSSNTVKRHQSPGRHQSPEHCCVHTPSRSNAAKRHQSPGTAEHEHNFEQTTSRSNTVKKHQSPSRVQETGVSVSDFKKSKQKNAEKKREPIHPLEMLLDPSPDERDIPTMGELEHRMRILDENRDTPSPSSRKSQSKSPIRNQTYTEFETPFTPSPTDGLPTAEQLEARLAALEREHKFDFKMQKNYKQFNQKLKDIVSPSLSFEEFKAARSSPSESASKNVHRSPSPRVTTGCAGVDSSCPKVIRFHDVEHSRPKSRHDSEIMVSMSNDVLKILEENSNIIQRLLKKPIADSSAPPVHCSLHEGLGVMGIRLMRETSPLRRTGTHTGVPLRTGENINDQLTSIQNSIKSIDSLCEEKPYKRERCQQYIDSLFTDSIHFASKKSSLDDLTSRHLSRSASREYGPSIRISEHSPAFTRSIGSAESIRSSSPLRPITPLQYHSNRDLRREISPRRRRDEEREEYESRVRRDNLMPNIHNYNHSSLSHSLTKFHKVDSQLNSNDFDVIDVELLGSNETSSIRNSNTNTSTTATNSTTMTLHNNAVPTNDTTLFKGNIHDRPISPYRQLGLGRSNTPLYTPAKLEIRHTTVTSTFYDRVLAEKQLEKKHSTANASKSPLLELPIRPCFQSNRSPNTLASPDSATLTLAGPGSTTGNYRSYHSDIHQTKTPSPVVATTTLSESQNTSISPKT